VLFLGMNPGPFGMAQTGVAFGEVAAVRDWIGVEAPVGKPAVEHPARPVQGFDCPRSEVSGQRLWGLFAQRFGTPDTFFREHFVINYCPLLFLQAEGKRCRNLTPDKLPVGQTAALYEACDRHLKVIAEILEAQWLIGVGKFAENRAAEALEGLMIRIGGLLHPSPASPAANRGWAEQAVQQLVAQEVWE
jgi:single-strand selective monofunctional uracil DNA glycosylase